MAKPKATETVVWEDDVWGHVDEPEAASPPAPEALASSSVVEAPAAKPEPAVGRGGVSLAKRPWIQALEPAQEVAAPMVQVLQPSAPPTQRPPTLPPPIELQRPAPATQPVSAPSVQSITPPPLPPAPVIHAKLAARKPPGGISSIFRQDEPVETAANPAPTPRASQMLKPALKHPKLGPAFSRETDDDSTAG